MSSRDLSLIRADLAALTLTVARLTERVAALELGSAEDQEFELVGEAAASGSATPGSAAAEGVRQAGLSALRVEVAESVGAFLGRAVRGEHRGNSGRSRVNLSSRVYIVLAGFDGRVLEEPLLFSSFGPARELCLRGPDSGSSIFVGLPSQAEAAIALRAAGLSWPVRGIDGRDGGRESASASRRQ